MWLGDVPSPAPCAVLGAGSPPRHGAMLGAGAVATFGDPGGCPPLSRGGCSSAMLPAQCWVFAPVPGAPWDQSLVPSPGVKAQRPVEPRDFHSSCLSGVTLAAAGAMQNVSP